MYVRKRSVRCSDAVGVETDATAPYRNTCNKHVFQHSNVPSDNVLLCNGGKHFENSRTRSFVYQQAPMSQAGCAYRSGMLTNSKTNARYQHDGVRLHFASRKLVAASAYHQVMQQQLSLRNLYFNAALFPSIYYHRAAAAPSL